MDVLTIMTPFFCAALGYGTNWLAIKMLFRPHREISWGRFKLPFTPGLMPKERYVLAKKIGETISVNILTAEAVEEALANSEFGKRLRGAVNSAVDSVLFNESGLIPFTEIKNISAKAAEYIAGLEESNPALDGQLRDGVKRIAEDSVGKFAGLFINYDKLYSSIKEKLCEFIRDGEAGDKLGGFLSSLTDENREMIKEKAGEAVMFALRKGSAALASSLDFAKIIEERINLLDVAETERLIVSIANRELKAITAVGGVIGFIIGLVPVVLALV
jgi:uncharacterized membrane protein YheB (UPF0754 family)